MRESCWDRFGTHGLGKNEAAQGEKRLGERWGEVAGSLWEARGGPGTEGREGGSWLPGLDAKDPSGQADLLLLGQDLTGHWDSPGVAGARSSGRQCPRSPTGHRAPEPPRLPEAGTVSPRALCWLRPRPPVGWPRTPPASSPHTQLRSTRSRLAVPGFVPGTHSGSACPRLADLKTQKRAGDEKPCGGLRDGTGWGSCFRGPRGAWQPQHSVCLLACREPRGDLGDGGAMAVGPVHALPSTCLQRVEEQPEDADNQRNVTRMGSQPADPGAPVHVPAVPAGPPAEGTVVPSEYLLCVPVCRPLSCPRQLLGNGACLRVVPQLGRKPCAVSVRALTALASRARGQCRHCYLSPELCVPYFRKPLQVTREAPGTQPGAGPGLPSWAASSGSQSTERQGCREVAAGSAGCTGGRHGGRRALIFPATRPRCSRPPGLCELPPPFSLAGDPAWAAAP